MNFFAWHAARLRKLLHRHPQSTNFHMLNIEKQHLVNLLQHLFFRNEELFNDHAESDCECLFSCEITLPRILLKAKPFRLCSTIGLWCNETAFNKGPLIRHCWFRYKFRFLKTCYPLCLSPANMLFSFCKSSSKRNQAIFT